MGRVFFFIPLFIVGVCRGFPNGDLDNSKVNKISNILRGLESELQERTHERADENELRDVFGEGEAISDPAFASTEGNGDVPRFGRRGKVEDISSHDRVESKSIPAPRILTGEITPTSVELLILPPKVGKEKLKSESNSTAYDVVYFKDGCEDYWNWVHVRRAAGNVTSFAMTGLQPWTRYGFSVVLDTGYEIGKPAFISVLTAEEGVPSAPTVHVAGVTASNATLLISPSPERVVPPVSSFIIEVQDLGEEPSAYFTVEVSDEGPTRFVLDQLLDGESYVVTVKPRSNATVGTCTSVVITTTARPPKVIQKSIKSSSLYVEVSPSKDTQGRNIRYRLAYFPVGADEDQAGGFTDVCVGDASCEFHIDGLLGNQLYVISVAALTGLGFGPETILRIKTTKPTRPGLIKIISPYNGRERSNYNLQWRRPLSGGDTIQTYYIEYSQIVRGKNWWTVTYVGKKNIVKLRDGTATSYRIRNLQPDTFYEVRMTAENEQGRSIVSHKIFKTAA